MVAPLASVDELLSRIDRELVDNEQVVRIADQHVQDLIGEVPEYVRERARRHFGRTSHGDVVAAAQAQSISPGLRSML